MFYKFVSLAFLCLVCFFAGACCHFYTVRDRLEDNCKAAACCKCDCKKCCADKCALIPMDDDDLFSHKLQVARSMKGVIVMRAGDVREIVDRLCCAPGWKGAVKEIRKQLGDAPNDELQYVSAEAYSAWVLALYFNKQ